jgi:hypothetical protein
MMHPVSSSLSLASLKATLTALLAVILLLGSGAGRVVAQDATATAEATGAFIETVGGQTMRELPSPIYYDEDGNGMLDAGELATAVEERYPKVIWPVAHVVPLEDLLAAIEASEQAAWPISAEFRVLEIPAVCAWFEAYQDAYAGGDAFQQAAALDMATYTLGGARSLSTEELLGGVDAIRYATLGDASLIDAYVEEGPCQDEAWFEEGVATPVASPVG